MIRVLAMVALVAALSAPAACRDEHHGPSGPDGSCAQTPGQCGYER